MTDLHSALKTTILQEIQNEGLHFKLVRLQQGKNDFVDTLHVKPSSYSTYGLQSTDVLNFLGFKRSQCAFHNGECYVRAVSSSIELPVFVESAGIALKYIREGAGHLENCGIFIPQPEGYGFFYGQPSEGRHIVGDYASGGGHVAPKVQRMKESEDQYFKFVFTWIEGASDRGWTTHFHGKHMPLAPEFSAALEFLGGFNNFNECPEFDFDPCWWRFASFKPDSRGLFGINNDFVHRSFDALSTNFSSGLEKLLAAHAELHKNGFSFLKVKPTAPSIPSPTKSLERVGTKQTERPIDEQEFDVAITFAGTEREFAKQLAQRVKDAGFRVFYDDFYPEQLWGKDLIAFFDRVYRKASRYCVMFVSAEYASRIWTTHERRSAQARALQEKGGDYILPIRMDDTDLAGLPPTVGYLNIRQYNIDQIAELLLAKLTYKNK
jgi:TIR domain